MSTFVSVELHPLVEYVCGQRIDIPTNHVTSHAHVPLRVITTQPTPVELKWLVDDTKEKG